MKEAFIIVGCNYGIATFIDFKSKTVSLIGIFASKCNSGLYKFYFSTKKATEFGQIRIHREHQSCSKITESRADRPGHFRCYVRARNNTQG